MKKEEKLFSVKPGFVVLRLNSKVYPVGTIFAAGYVFLERAYILLDKDKDYTLVYLYPQKKEKNLNRLGLDFYNELLNYAHYFSRTKTNAEAIKTLMQRALFSAAPSLAQEAEEKEIQDLIKELEDEEKNETTSTKTKK